MKVLVQFRPQSASAEALAAGASEVMPSIERLLPEVQVDTGYGAAEIPELLSPSTVSRTLDRPLAFSSEPEQSARLVRGEVTDDPAVLSRLLARPEVSGVFGDPQIQTCLVCAGSPPVGTDADVARQLDVSALAAQGLDGTGVPLAIVDTGINLAHLNSRGRTPPLDTGASFTYSGATAGPGQHATGHGTMCAYDAGIAAPAATLLDHAVLRSSSFSSQLSDAILSYSRLLAFMRNQSHRALVVSNSWAMFDPAWDFPPGHPGNYSHNPAHPFNIIVASLESAGADILFAAGNCGRDCPAGSCAFGAAPPICGANSHPRVLSVAGVDTTRARVGYSSQGPGVLSAQKPDISAYTHFQGSGVGTTDSGTSAACPVAAGVVAAIRTKHSALDISPDQLRSLIFKTAVDLGMTGFDDDHGWGLIDPQPLAAAVAKAAAGIVHAPPFRGRNLRYPPMTVGDDARLWQERMVQRGTTLGIDGKYGGQSKQACSDFQRLQSLQADGVVGPVTWAATWEAPM